MPIIAKKWRKVLFSYEHDWMATDPRFLTEQSVNMYFEIFKLLSPPGTECSSQVMARKYKVNSL